MSNYLAIDTSSRYLTVLAVKDGKKVLRHNPDCAMQHSVTLMDEVQAALDEAGLTPAECDFFAAVTGPGSFTGIRIGIAAAKGFALGADKPLLSITSFGLIAYNVADEDFYTVIDAAHSHYYVCGFKRSGEVTLDPCYMSAEEVTALNGRLYGFEALSLPNYTRVEISGCLYPAVEKCKGKLSRQMTALYVRKSQAEEGRK